MSAPAKQIMNTPRTDAADSACGVSGDFARTLERELGEARNDLVLAAGELMLSIAEPGSDMARCMSANVLMRRERDQWRAVADELANAHLALDLGEDSKSALAAYEKLKAS